MTSLYPYDPDATVDGNYITETLSVLTHPNKFNAVIPTNAPFYRMGLEVRNKDNRLLVEGLDYYLGYYYSKMSDGVGKAVYGGLLLPDDVIVTVKHRVVGSDYAIPISEIGRHLTSLELKDPRNVDFTELQRYPAVIKPIDKPESLEEAIAKDVIVAALDGLRARMETNVEDLDGKYGELFNAMSNLATKMQKHELFVHHKTPHQHLYTREELGVLGETETAVDALKAYGLTLQELVNNMLTFGINESRVDGLLDRNLKRTLKGCITAGPEGLSFKNDSHPGTAVVLNGYGLEFTSSDYLDIAADTEYTTPGIGLEIGAGLNVLFIPSAGNVKGGKPSFNGRVLITSDDVTDYLYKPTTAELKVTSENTDTFEFYGIGTTISPLSGQATPPHATLTKEGLYRITDSTSVTSEGYAISQFALSEINDTLSEHVMKTFTVNNVAFGEDESITITKTHIGLSLVNNTAPQDKPVTIALTNALKEKALIGHAHQKGDLLNVPIADHDTEGLAQLHDIIDATRGKAATAKQGLELKTLIDEVEVDVNRRIKSDAASATYYGGDGYLPVPVLGNYGHANYSYPSFYAEDDRNDKFTMLVNLASSFGRGVFYQELQLSDSGTVISHVKTSVEYLPDFLKKIGRKAKYVFGGYRGVFTIQDDTGVNWLVISNGTMDMSKHFGAVDTGTMGRDVKHFIVGNYVYRGLLQCGLPNNRFQLARTSLTKIKEGELPVWESMILKGDDIYGNHIESTIPQFAPLDISTDVNAQAMVWRNDNNKWVHVGVRHSSQNWDIGVDGNTVTFFGFQRSYCSNSAGSSYGNSDQTTSILIDLTNGEFIIADSDKMKLTLNESGIVSQDHSNLMTWNGIHPNSSSCRLHGKNFSVCGSWYGTHANPKLTVYTRKGLSDKQLCGRKALPAHVFKSSVNLIGAHPSVVQSVRSMPCWVDDTTIVYRDMLTGINICKVNPDVPYEGDNGFGPTTDRKAFTGNYGDTARIPRIWIEGERRNEGYTGVPNERRNTFIDIYGNASNPHIWDNASGGALLAQLKAEMLTRNTTTPELYRGGMVFLSVFGSPSNPIGAFVLYAFWHYSSDAKTSSHTQYEIHEVDLSVNTGTIVVNNNTRVLRWSGRVQGSTTGLSTTIPECPQSMCYRTEEGLLGFAVHACPSVSYVGNGGRIDYHIEKNSDGTTWQRVQTHYAYQFSDLWGYHPKLGFYRYSQSPTADAIIAYPAGFKSEDIRRLINKGTCYILASAAEEGWIIYFTQDMPFYSEQSLYSVKATNIDLRVVYPKTHQNNTFYIHVEVIEGVTKYTMSDTVLPDTPTRLWIGHVTTDSSRITELVVERAKRLGNVATLIQHEHNKFAHGYEYSDTLATSEYTQMINKGLIHEFETMSFKDVFNSWYRFSHSSANTYPANANELKAWRYIEEYDCVECTINSGTYIGFISDKKAGDYTFNTIVTALDGDDDAITIVLAAHRKGDIDDREHTLSLVMNTGGVNGSFIRLNENYLQPGGRIIRIIDPNKVPPNSGNPWTPKMGHIYARRVKNILTIFTELTTFSASPTGEGRDEIIQSIIKHRKGWTDADYRRAGFFETVVDLAQEAPIFNTAVRFGYGAQSQNKARYWNLERPLSDLGNFYSSEQTLYSAKFANSDNVKKFHGSIVRVPQPFNPNNYNELAWGNAVERVGSQALPVPTAKRIAPTATYAPLKGAVFYVKKRLSFPSGIIKIKAAADDVLHLYIDGVKKTLSHATLTTFNVTPGVHTIVIGSEEVPGSSPCYVAFGIYDNASLIAVSDTSWPTADSGYSYFASSVINKIEYMVDSGYSDVFSVQPDLGQSDAITVVSRTETVEADGRKRVSNYVDMAKAATARWDVILTKSNLN